MGWSTRFVAELTKTSCTPQFLLEGYSWASSTKIIPTWRISSSPLVGALKNAMLVLDGASCTGPMLDPREATMQLASFSVPFRGSPAEVFRFARRGQIVALKMGFPGWDIGAYERIELGVLHDIAGKAGLYVVECRDIGSYFQNRPASSATNLEAFSAIGSTTTTTASYSVGATTISVNTTSNFEKQNDGSGSLKGAIRVEAATPFYLTYTGKTGTTFTGLSATGQFGTTAANASSGTTVTEIALIDDHPIDAVRRVITSTGTAVANGAYDWLPTTWGFAVPDGLIDHDDCNFFRGKSQPSGGSDDYDILVEEQQPDGWAWMQQMLSPGGYFLTTHQGSIVARCVVNPRNTMTKWTRTWVIGDDDIMIDGFENSGWSDQFAVEYCSMRVVSASSSTSRSGTLSTWPAMERIERDVSMQVYTNETNQRQEILNRLHPWWLRVPEILTVRLRGWWWAALGPGDVTEVTSSYATGREDINQHGYAARRAMVIGRTPNWFGAPYTDLTLALITDPDGKTA